MGGSPIMASDQGIGETDQSFIETTENGQQTQNNMANTLQAAGISLNSGLTQNSMDENRVQTMSSDLVESTEGTDSRQLIGNGKEIFIPQSLMRQPRNPILSLNINNIL